MISKTILNIIQTSLLILIIVLGSADTSDAQRKKRGRGKKKKGGEPTILKDLPEFFVNDDVMPKYLQLIYKRDATRLALRLLNKEQRVSKQTVRVPEELVDAIYNALVAVRTSDFESIDELAKKYNVRSFPVPNVENLVLVFEHDAPWIEPLKQREDTTGSVSINSLIRKYNLVITKIVYLDEERAGLVLRSRQPLNMPALMMHFFTEEGVLAIDEILPYGDGNDIEIIRTKSGWDLKYSVRFGNCVTQCQKYHDWSFSVDAEGEVTYNGTSGHTIPPWIKPDARAERFKDVIKR